MATVLVNGVNLYYKEMGIGDPLVLIHGMGSNADIWEAVMPALAKTYRVIAYDRRAYQRSQGVPPPLKEYNCQQAQDLAVLLQALNAAPATLVGWSLGGVYALHVALNCPALVQQLILYEPPLYAVKHITWPMFTTVVRLNVAKALGRPQAAEEAFLRMVFAYADGRNSYDHLSPQLRAMFAKDTPTFMAELATGSGEDLAPAALTSQIKMPVKLLLGDQSPALFQSAMQRLTRIFPQAPLIKIPNGNHLAHIEEPEVFVKSLQAALVIAY